MLISDSLSPGPFAIATQCHHLREAFRHVTACGRLDRTCSYRAIVTYDSAIDVQFVTAMARD